MGSDSDSGWQKVAACSVLIVFTFYVFGFLAWQAHLGNYGTSIGFFQKEYITAALCYLFTLANIAVPTLFIYTIFRSARNSGRPNAAMCFGMLVWVCLYWFVTGQEKWRFPQGSDSTRTFLLLLVVIFSILVILLLSNGERVGVWLTKKMTPLIYGSLISVLAVLVLFIMKVHDHWFLAKSIPVALFWLVLYHLRADAKPCRESWEAQVVIGMTAFVVLFFHVTWFGKEQFERLPREMGGGQPETVRAIWSQEATNGYPLGSTNLFQVLFRSEREIVMVDYSEWTNSVAGCGTNKRPTAVSVRADLVRALVFTSTPRSP